MLKVAIIPARMGSTRFPGKPLAPILGIPMIEHVYQRTKMAAVLDAVYIATCDEEIQKAAEAFGGEVIMTSPRHERASDRVAEAALSVDADIVVLIQGDEPMITPGMIEQAVEPLTHSADVACVNLASRINDEAEHRDPNTVKVVTDRQGNALYFSREPIPSPWKMGYQGLPIYKQVCVIPFRQEILARYSELQMTPLEEAESIDMLRFLEHGYRVRMVETQTASYPVDTPADLKRVERLMRKDALVQRYMKL